MASSDRLALKLQRLKALIEAEYGSRWMAKSLAAAVGLSAAEMRIEFRRQFGKTALSYLRDVCLGEAADRLAAGKSVSETAEACGFSSCGSLSRNFHKSTGIFPSHYRFKVAGWKHGASDPAARR